MHTLPDPAALQAQMQGWLTLTLFILSGLTSLAAALGTIYAVFKAKAAHQIADTTTLRVNGHADMINEVKSDLTAVAASVTPPTVLGQIVGLLGTFGSAQTPDASPAPVAAPSAPEPPAAITSDPTAAPETEEGTEGD